jgi:hypothetical protein
MTAQRDNLSEVESMFLLTGQKKDNKLP